MTARGAIVIASNLLARLSIIIDPQSGEYTGGTQSAPTSLRANVLHAVSTTHIALSNILRCGMLPTAFYLLLSDPDYSKHILNVQVAIRSPCCKSLPSLSHMRLPPNISRQEVV